MVLLKPVLEPPIAMRKLFLFCSALTALMLLSPGHADDGQDRAIGAGASLIGTLAPAVKLKTIDGQDVDLGRLYGHKPVYLKFWATWCVPCREQMPHFESTYEKHRADMAVIAVNAGFNDSVADIRAYRTQIGLKMPIVLDDGRLADAFHLRVTPQHIVIGRDGRIIYIGHRVDDQLESALASAGARPASAVRTAALAGAAETPLGIGDPVGNLNVTTVDGVPMSLGGSGQGRQMIVAFISPWCESYLAKSRPQRSQACTKARESIQTLAKADPQQQIIGLSSGLWANRDDVVDYGREHGLSIPLAVDDSGALFRKFGIKDVPAFIVIGADGRLVSRSSELQPAAR